MKSAWRWWIATLSNAIVLGLFNFPLIFQTTVSYWVGRVKTSFNYDPCAVFRMKGWSSDLCASSLGKRSLLLLLPSGSPAILPITAQCIPLLPDPSPSGRADLLLWVRLPQHSWVLCKLQKSFTSKPRAPPDNLHSILLCHTVQWNTSKDCQHNIVRFYAMYLQVII